MILLHPILLEQSPRRIGVVAREFLVRIRRIIRERLRICTTLDQQMIRQVLQLQCKHIQHLHSCVAQLRASALEECAALILDQLDSQPFAGNRQLHLLQ